jgi:hypothetical protein
VPFKEYGLWGALSKTNHGVLRYREPIYRSIRELIMSYFHEYMLNDGRKTLRRYSCPLNLNTFGTYWITAEKDLWEIDSKLDEIKHCVNKEDSLYYIHKNGAEVFEENSKKEELHSNAIYYGMMKTINEEAVNFQEILLNLQNICFVKMDTNEDVSNDIYILLLIYSLKANYELSKSREIALLNKLSDKKKYLKIKRMASSIILFVFTVLCRNVNGAE